MNNAPPPPQADPGPALHPARALATCIDGLLSTMLRVLARLGFLGRLINPQAAHIAHLLQSLATLLARFAAGDLPPRVALLPATPLAPSRLRASSPASPSHAAPPRAPNASLRPRLPPCARHRRAERPPTAAAIPRPVHSPRHRIAPSRLCFVRTKGNFIKFTILAATRLHA